MSYARSSALRWFESILEDARKRARAARGKITLRRLLERAVRLGDVVFPKLVYLAEKAANLMGKLQITMIESMIMASILYGLLLLALTIIVALR